VPSLPDSATLLARACASCAPTSAIICFCSGESDFGVYGTATTRASRRAFRRALLRNDIVQKSIISSPQVEREITCAFRQP